MANLNDLPREALPRLVNLPHPLTADGRQVAYLPFTRNETLGGYVRRNGIEVANGPVAVMVNGYAVEDWARYRLKTGDSVVIRAVVRGGGGGGNKMLRTVAMIAIAVAAAYSGGAAAAAYGGSAAGAMASAAVMIGGSLLVNALLPPPKLDTGLGGFGGGAAASPTYALSGARNRQRPFEPMPLVIGRHRIVPDLAGQPFTEYVGQDQYLYQSYHFGLQSDLQLSDFKIGDTPLQYYQNVDVYHAAADGQLPAMFGDVDTNQGREITNADGWVVRTSSADAIGLGVDLQASVYYANDQGGMDTRTVTVEMQYRAVPNGGWSPLAGGQATLGGNSPTPVRQTINVVVPRGQYEVRFRKLTGDVSSSRERNDVALSALRTLRYDSTDYTGQRRVGLKIKASAQLNGAVDELSAIAVASCPVWTGSAWVTQPTTNPAWWYLWAARGKRDAKGRRLYGGGLADTRIDIEAIKAWAAWCDANRLAVSMVLDQKQSIADLLTTIARAGRARYTWQPGKLSVIWDQADLPIVAVFGPANITAGSFTIDYTGEKVADEVILNFANEAKNWAADSVRVAVPGVISPGNPVTLDMTGVTSADQAGREANLIAASQLYHRRRTSWETDVEGFVAGRGDVVLLSHDMASWSHSGRLVGGTRGKLQLDRSVPLGPGAWVGIRFPDGRYATYRVRTGSGEAGALTLTDLIPTGDNGGPLPVPDESTDQVPYDWLWFYDVGAKPGRRVKIVEVHPSPDGERVRFVAADDVPAYYAAENGNFQGSTGNSTTLPPIVGFLTLAETTRITGDGRRVAVMTASWPAMQGATHYLLRWRRVDGAWSERSVPDTHAAIDLEPGDYEASVSAVFATGISAPAVQSLTVRGNQVAPLPAPVFTATGEPGQISLRWSWPDMPALKSVRLYASTGGGPLVLLTELPRESSNWVHQGLSIGVRVDYELRIVDSWGNVSAAVSASATTIKDPSKLLEQLQGSIGGDALTDELRTPIGKIPAIESSANGATESALKLLTKVDDALNRLRREGAITDATTEVDPVTGQIRLKAIAQITTDVEARLRELGFQLDAATGAITATNLQVTQQGNRLTAAESSIEQLAGQITQKVDAAYVDGKVVGMQDGVAGNAAALDALTESALRGVVADDALRSLQRVHAATAQQQLAAQADDLMAQARYALTLAAQIADNAAALVRESTARVTADSAQVRDLTALQATVAGNTAAIRDESTARADGDGALAQQLTQLQAKTDTNSAAIQTEQAVRSNADSAAAQRIDTLQSTVGEHTASIQSQQEVIDGVKSKALLQVTAENKVAGWAAYADKNGSKFDILADKFAVSLPDGTGSRQVFTVGTINGQPAAGLAGDMIIDGTLTSRAIMAEGIDADRINTRRLTIKDDNGNVVVDMTGMGSAYIKGQLTAGQIDTRNLTVRDGYGNVVVDAGGMHGSWIKNLSVDTLKIAGRAITAPNLAYAEASIIAPSTWSTVQEISFYTSGEWVMLWMNYLYTGLYSTVSGGGRTNGYMQWRILRDGGQVNIGSVASPPDGGGNVSLSRGDWLSAGWHTYTLQIWVPVPSSATIGARSLLTLEAKR